MAFSFYSRYCDTKYIDCPAGFSSQPQPLPPYEIAPKDINLCSMSGKDWAECLRQLQEKSAARNTGNRP